MRPRLLVIAGPVTGTTHGLIDRRLRIGRDKANELCLSDAVVSRRHCTIEPVGDQFVIADLDSRNGTFVNGIPIRRRTLEHGDTVRIGASELVFLTHEGETVVESSYKSMDGSAVSELSTIRIDGRADLFGFGLEVGRMARDLTALVKISSAINSIRDLELLQQRLLKLILEVIPADESAVVLQGDADVAADPMTTLTRRGSGGPIAIKPELLRRALWECAPVLSNAPSDLSATQNLLCVPLIGLERSIGVLYLSSKGEASSFREDHLHFLDSVCRIAAITIENVLTLDSLRSENRRLKEEFGPNKTLVGESTQIRRVEEFVERVANTDSTVLIRGESGTGKEVVARTIHDRSSRRDRPFIAINCAAIPESLLESELFGHEKGAFTGAVGLRKGRLEASSDGTLFLDEIGELAPSMQAKLLRVLQQREFERVGGTQPVPFSARVLAATNKNLEHAIKRGEFRQDLYYRLNVVSITIPPLREHRDDIPLLALYFAAKYAEKSKRPFKGVSREARTLLTGYSWPGNVRELENAIEHAIVLGLTDEIMPEDLPETLIEEQAIGGAGAKYHDTLREAKKELIRTSIREANGSVPAAAQLLGLHPKYLHRLMRSLKLKPEPL